KPDVLLEAIDADVIKTYVELGLGIAILPTVAYEPDRDRNLQVRDASGLFEPTIARIEIRRSSFLRDYMYDFIRLVAPSWNREMIDQIMRSGPR
ncbi:MAG: transcriptional regulator, partial [Burkholderiales bacterium]